MVDFSLFPFIQLCFRSTSCIVIELQEERRSSLKERFSSPMHITAESSLEAYRVIGGRLKVKRRENRKGEDVSEGGGERGQIMRSVDNNAELALD